MRIPARAVREAALSVLLVVALPLALASPTEGVSMKPGSMDRQAGSLIATSRAPRFQSGVDRPEPITGPVLGARKVMVLLVEFSDNRADKTRHSPAAFQRLLFDVTGAIPTGSLHDYFQEVSCGKLSLTGSVSVWIEAPQSNAFYAGGQFGQGRWPYNSMRLAYDAIVAADPYVDFSLFDGDHDGTVDGLFIVHAGPGGEETGKENDLWSHKGTVPANGDVSSSGYLTDDGALISAYTLQPEEDDQGHLINIGVFCHEYGHVLGLPDLYDRDYSSMGIGNWCLMGTGSWGGDGQSPETPVHPCAWAKEQLGWIAPRVIVADGEGFQLGRVEDQAEAFRLWTGGRPLGQYFLLENRESWGFDSKLPGSGLLIWHIDSSVSTQNDDEHHKLVDLEAADGAADMDLGLNGGDGGDPFPGSRENRTFDSISRPGSADYDGQPSHVSVRHISDCGPVMTADLFVSENSTWIMEETADGSQPAGSQLYQNYPNPFNSTTTISYSLPVQSEEFRVNRQDNAVHSQLAARHVRIQVFNILGQTICTLHDGPAAAGSRAVTWDGTSQTGLPVPGGIYFCRLEADHFNQTRRMLLVK